ncbi:efflux RND transporter periplasmic adaptor subunit [Azospirillum sp. TSA2s]|uniref:efflux RND transporter periplasmic adaptor subunit n=1 Tax=Azospirillum sp. TSA2s TaxID=709810 RepID=UPI00145A1794|nr:efflux RND transporter periplasmic adaptor subunit [Azospirillum sp. TSA2s]
MKFKVDEGHEQGAQSPSFARRGRLIFLGALLLAVLGGIGGVALTTLRPGATGSAAAASAPPGVPVTVGTAMERDLPIWLSGIGSVQPLNAVAVKVRVDGQLNLVAFTEGQEVHAGDLLAQIDPRPFEAQLKQAQANLAKDQAQLGNAKADLARVAKLASTGFASGQNADTVKAQAASLEATVQADQAMVDTARLQLGFTRITSPIDGRVGLRQLDPGSIVHPTDANGLVTVTQMQPIGVLFSLPQDDLPGILAASAQGKPVVEAYTRDGKSRLAQGELTFVDSQVDATNGQVRFKATFANGDRALWPGAFVTARLLVRTEHNATAVPSRAVQRGQKGPYVFIAKPDRTAEMRAVTLGPTVDGMTALASGVTPGEMVVFDGQSRLSAGSRIAPKPGSLHESAQIVRDARTGHEPCSASVSIGSRPCSGAVSKATGAPYCDAKSVSPGCLPGACPTGTPDTNGGIAGFRPLPRNPVPLLLSPLPRRSRLYHECRRRFAPEPHC